MHPDWTLSPCTTSETRKLETCQDTVQAYLLSTSLLRAYAICFPAFTTRFTRQLTCQDVDSYMFCTAYLATKRPRIQAAPVSISKFRQLQ